FARASAGSAATAGIGPLSSGVCASAISTLCCDTFDGALRSIGVLSGCAGRGAGSRLTGAFSTLAVRSARGDAAVVARAAVVGTVAVVGVARTQSITRRYGS